MITVRDLLRRKGSDVWSIEPERSVLDALRLMAEKKIGAVLVVRDERPVGILSERDYARKVVLLDRTSEATRVEEIMSPDPVCVRPDQTVEDCMAVMTARRFRHLPVVEDDRVIGLISIGDVVKRRIAEAEFEARAMREYIATG